MAAAASPRASSPSPPKSPRFAGALQPHTSPRARPGSPGPGAYFKADALGTSGMGKQVVSTKPSSAACRFGTATREAYAKTYMDKEISSRVPSSLTAKAEFLRQDYATIGAKGPDSRHETTPKFSFGKASRDAYTKTYISAGHQKLLPVTVTAGVEFRKPVEGLGKAAPESTRPSSPKYSFGKCSREAASKMFLSAEIARKSPSTITAGVGFLPLDSLERVGAISGRQVESTRKTSPTFGFGTATREHTAVLVMESPRRMKKSPSP